MKLLFGPNVDSNHEIESALNFSNEAVELSFTRTQKIFYDKNANELLKKFKYISIHMPVLKDKEFISYPDNSISDELETIDSIINDINPNTILFHPDQIRDFNWVKEKYGGRLAFENMDSRKNFGKTIGDMTKVFDSCPEAKFVLDVNHVYTNDETMNLATILFNGLSNRLTHYHLSGFGGLHNALCQTHEDIILKGIKSLDKPIIHEGDLLNKNLLINEFEYIIKRI
jgi:hypothetical protein